MEWNSPLRSQTNKVADQHFYISSGCYSASQTIAQEKVTVKDFNGSCMEAALLRTSDANQLQQLLCGSICVQFENTFDDSAQQYSDYEDDDTNDLAAFSATGLTAGAMYGYFNG